jgi:hypothetical protein
MPVAKEFIVLMEDRPSTLGKVCRALADREVNILALKSFPIGGKSVTRFIVDKLYAPSGSVCASNAACRASTILCVLKRRVSIEERRGGKRKRTESANEPSISQSHLRFRYVRRHR